MTDEQAKNQLALEAANLAKTGSATGIINPINALAQVKPDSPVLAEKPITQIPPTTDTAAPFTPPEPSAPEASLGLMGGLQANVDAAKVRLEAENKRQEAELKAKKDELLKQQSEEEAKQLESINKGYGVSPVNLKRQETIDAEEKSISELRSANLKSIGELENLANEGISAVEAMKSKTGLDSIRTPKITETANYYNARVGLIQAAMAARSGNISQGENLIDRTVTALNTAKTDQLNYYTAVGNFYSGIKDDRGKSLIRLDDKEQKIIDERKAAIQKEIDDSEAVADTVKKMMLDDPNRLEGAGITLNDSLDEIKTKLSKYDQKVAPTLPLLQAGKAAQEFAYEMIKKYPDAGIDSNDTLISMKDKITKSKSYLTELSKTSGTEAPTLRLKGQDEYGMNIYEQYNPTTKSWEATSSEVAGEYAAGKIGGTDAYSSATNNAMEKVISGLQVQQQKVSARKDIENAYQGGNPSLVVEKLKTTAKDSMGMEAKSRFEGSEKALEILPKIKNDLGQYISKGGNLNIFTGTLEQIAGKLGTVKDAELRRLATEIQAYLMDYRRSMTGAQFSEQETGEYKLLLPTTKDTLETSNAKIDGFITAKKYDVDAGYSTMLGKDNWTQLKQMSGYQNTIDRSEYDKMVSSVGQQAADKVLQDSKTWIIDSPKAEAPVTGGDIKSVSVGGKDIKVSSRIASKIEKADADFYAATGQHIKVNQSYRTTEEQKALYEKLSPSGARVAKPGTSFHEKGLAIDVTNWKEAEPYLRKYGLVNPMTDDKGHFSFGEWS
jgi:hypothetical protein